MSKRTLPRQTSKKYWMNKDYQKYCFMCREKMTAEIASEEHIYPKWLLKRYDLKHEKLILPNGQNVSYHKFKVPCCKKCNNEIMSSWEKMIERALKDGFDAFVTLDEEIIVWWLMKIYYAKLIFELKYRIKVGDPNSEMLMTDEQLERYNIIYFYMSELLQGSKFNTPKPYELYIFKLDDSDKKRFDYIDNISGHVLYMQLDNILIICALDSFSCFKEHYQNEVDVLRAKDSINRMQGIELYVKIMFYRLQYGYYSIHVNKTDETGCIESIVMNRTRIRNSSPEELYFLQSYFSKLKGNDMNCPPYEKGMRFSFISPSESGKAILDGADIPPLPGDDWKTVYLENFSNKVWMKYFGSLEEFQRRKVVEK